MWNTNFFSQLLFLLTIPLLCCFSFLLFKRILQLRSSTPSVLDNLRYTLSSLNVYVRDNDEYVDVVRLPTMTSNGEEIKKYDVQNDGHCDTRLSDLVRWSMHLGQLGSTV